MNSRKHYFTLGLAFSLIIGGSVAVLAQNHKKKEIIEINNENDDVVMTWNKTTPESEMKDDVKALKKYGVIINYSDVKRNANKEITGLKVSYEDEKGNKGELKLNQQSPISTINFYKSGNEIGFGTPSNSNPMNSFSFGGAPNGSAVKIFGFHDEDGNPSTENFRFNFSDKNESPKSTKKSKIIIKKSNKKTWLLKMVKSFQEKTTTLQKKLKKLRKSMK